MFFWGKHFFKRQLNGGESHLISAGNLQLSGLSGILFYVKNSPPEQKTSHTCISQLYIRHLNLLG